MILLCPLASAQAKDFSAIVSASSNYFYRGYSKSANSPTIRGNAEYQPASWFFLGSWISRVDFDDREFGNRSNVELYPYLGFNFKLAENWRLETSAARYMFDGRLFGKSSDYNEYSVSLHFSDLISGRIDFANDIYNLGGNSLNYEISARYPILEKLVASAGVGYNHAKPAVEYNALYWNIGITWFFKYYALDIRYVDLSESSPSLRKNEFELPKLDNNFVFTLSFGF